MAEASELWRPAIVFPLSGEAEAEVLNGTATDQTDVQVIPLDAGDLLHLWHGGLANAINAATDAMLDEHEEGTFSSGELPRLVGALRSWMEKPGGGGPTSVLVERVIAACEHAIARGTSALWIL